MHNFTCRYPCYSAPISTTPCCFPFSFIFFFFFTNAHHVLSAVPISTPYIYCCSVTPSHSKHSQLYQWVCSATIMCSIALLVCLSIIGRYDAKNTLSGPAYRTLHKKELTATDACVCVCVWQG